MSFDPQDPGSPTGDGDGRLRAALGEMSAPNVFRVPPPVMLVHTDRRVDANVRKVREFADQHGDVQAVAYSRSGYRMLKQIRDGLGDGYTSTLFPHRTTPSQGSADGRPVNVLLVRRCGGPSTGPRPVEEIHRRALASFAYWQQHRDRSSDTT